MHVHKLKNLRNLKKDRRRKGNQIVRIERRRSLRKSCWSKSQAPRWLLFNVHVVQRAARGSSNAGMLLHQKRRILWLGLLLTAALLLARSHFLGVKRKKRKRKKRKKNKDKFKGRERGREGACIVRSLVYLFDLGDRGIRRARGRAALL